MTSVEREREGTKKCLEHAPDSVSETRDEVVEYTLGVMGRCSRMTLLSRPYNEQGHRGQRTDRERTKIFLVSSIEVSLKYAVGPSGKCTKVIASSRLIGYSVPEAEVKRAGIRTRLFHVFVHDD
jgi:hypothetical protein